MTARDRAIAAVRTGAAALATGLIGWALSLGVDLPNEVDEELPYVFFVAGAAGYDYVANWLSSHVKWLGFLLLVPKQPAYDPTKPVLVPDTPPQLHDTVYNADVGGPEEGVGVIWGIVGVLLIAFLVIVLISMLHGK